jgi:hypothetical protein
MNMKKGKNNIIKIIIILAKTERSKHKKIFVQSVYLFLF